MRSLEDNLKKYTDMVNISDYIKEDILKQIRELVGEDEWGKIEDKFDNLDDYIGRLRYDEDTGIITIQNAHTEFNKEYEVDLRKGGR